VLTAIAFSLGAGLLLMRALMRSTELLVAGTEAVSRGEFEHRIAYDSADELVARIEALLRRAAQPAAEPVLRVADLVLDTRAKRARRGDRAIALTAKEFNLLVYLMEHAGSVVSRARLLNNVWALNFDPGTKVVDVYIRYLRVKIDQEGEVPLIRTVRGFGYVLDGGKRAEGARGRGGRVDRPGGLRPAGAPRGLSTWSRQIATTTSVPT
jgi:DNA-binding winged helix-turn-helix (wHTH) protein